MTEDAEWSAQTALLPAFDVKLAAPDLSQWRGGNTGVPGFWRFASSQPGSCVLIMALVHGNEIAGAIALDRLLRTGVRPARGTLILGFANLDAFDRFDPAQPTASRFVDEDMNRLWDQPVLDGPRNSVELHRARAMRKLVEEADILLDLHSMLWPSERLILSGPTARGRALALALGIDAMVVSDAGHATGRRLIDFAPFTSNGAAKVAVLFEAGQHWQMDTVEAMSDAIVALLATSGMIPPGPWREASPAGRCAEVTLAVTAMSGSFTFVQPFRGGDVVARRNTLIAVDGTTEIRTPYDDCILVMPSLRPSRGHTAVRLARFV